MPTLGTPTFDQLAIFLAVVDTGSFAGAGRKLNRAVSVISYGVANLESQLGLTLFDREGTKKPQLTVEGRAVLAEARAISASIAGLRAKAKGLLEGLEAEVRLVVDVLYPMPRVAAILREFNVAFPTVALRLYTEALGAVLQRILDGEADIAIAGPLVSEHDDIRHVRAGSVKLIPVAAPDHPLSITAPLAPGAGRDHIQLVLTDRSPMTEGRNFGVSAHHIWRLADIGSKHALLREGIGWGNMPVHMSEGDLMAGTLKHLRMPDFEGADYELSAIWRADCPPGPAAAWLIDRITQSSAETPAG